MFLPLLVLRTVDHQAPLLQWDSPGKNTGGCRQKALPPGIFLTQGLNLILSPVLAVWFSALPVPHGKPINVRRSKRQVMSAGSPPQTASQPAPWGGSLQSYTGILSADSDGHW